MSQPIWVICEGSGRADEDAETCIHCGAFKGWERSPDGPWLVWQPHYRQDIDAMRARGDFDKETSR